MRMEKRGVTIIELGIVIVLIGLITVLLSPFVRIIRSKAYKIHCVSNLQKISLAIREYALENNEKLPSDLSLIYTQGYVGDESVFDCPLSAHAGNAEVPDYDYIKLPDLNLSGNPVVAYDKKGNHADGSVNVLYLNGEIKSVSRLADETGDSD
jgi:type II secretory pathway pseudopilin PulG